MLSDPPASQTKTAPTGAGPLDSAPDPVNIDLDDLIALRWQAAATDLQVQRGLTGIPGLIATRIRGQGLEFDDLRIYQEGDDIRYLDWNVTARSGKPHIRLFREERERTVTIALDLGAAMFTGSQQLYAVSACRASAALMWHVAQNGGRCALVVHDGNSLTQTRPAPGERGVLAACAEMSAAFDRARDNALSGSPFDSSALSSLLEWVSRARRENGLSVLASSLDLADTNWSVRMHEAAQGGRLAVLWVRDPLEIDGLPPGAYHFLSEEGPTLATLNASQATALQQELDQHGERIERACREGLVPLAAYTGGSIPDLFESVRQAGF